MAKRNITEADRQAALRLQQIWEQKRRDLKLTQEQVAHACGWSTQGAFSQYLRAKIPLNTDAVLKLAKVLQVAPQEIMPEISDLLAAQSTRPLVSESALRLALAIESLPKKERLALQTLVDSLQGVREQEH